jgi:predicted amidophosphoribosyltransferase
VVIAGHETLMSGPSGGVCPTCNRGYNPGVKVCAVDGDELVPAAVASAGVGSRSLPSRGKICPTCGGRFDGAARFCGKDGTQLVLVN